MSRLRQRVLRAVVRAGNRAAVSLYRRSGGRIGGRAAKAPVLLLTTPGRRTGIPRTTAVDYFEHGDGLVVVGSAGGMPRDPDWFRNLRAAGETTVQIRRRTFHAKVRELTGAEREAAWRAVVAQSPRFAGYEKRTQRTIPLVLLTPEPS
jgi:deazaflavin-dependent oxidoreductase (nitroreductase family)